MKRLACLLLGHQPMFYDATSTVPGVTLMTTCVRCGNVVAQSVPVRERVRLRLVGKDQP